MATTAAKFPARVTFAPHLNNLARRYPIDRKESAMNTNFTTRWGRASAALAITGVALFAAGTADAREYRYWNHHRHHWNQGVAPQWHQWNNNTWRGGWNGWQSSNGYGYTWNQRSWAPPVYRAPTYYGAPQGYSYYPEPVAPSLNFSIPLR
jgi:hypothetical protein